MTTFSDFVLMEAIEEKAYLKELTIDMDGAMNLFVKNCGHMEWSKPLFRGATDRGDFILVEGQNGARESAHASGNHYTLIIDHFLKKNAKDYPLRSKSIICSTSKKSAQIYADENSKGDLYVLYPFNNVKIGVCATNDIQNFKLKPPIDEFILDFLDVLVQAGIRDENFEQIVEYIEHEINEEYNQYLIDYFGEGADEKIITKTLEDVFSVKGLGFTLINNQKIESIENDHEIWIGGKCLMIKYDVWKNFKDKDPHQHELEL